MALCAPTPRSARRPIIILTAKLEETDKVLGLELGADDYVTKPFSLRELTARVRAVLRRTGQVPPEPEVLRAADITLDRGSRQVTVGVRRVDLTPSEFDLLAALMAAPGRAFTRGELLDRVQGMAFDGYERTIDVHIRNLRVEDRAGTARPALCRDGFRHRLSARRLRWDLDAFAGGQADGGLCVCGADRHRHPVLGRGADTTRVRPVYGDTLSHRPGERVGRKLPDLWRLGRDATDLLGDRPSRLEPGPAAPPTMTVSSADNPGISDRRKVFFDTSVTVVDADRRVVYSRVRTPGEQLTADQVAEGMTLTADDATVGWLLFDEPVVRQPQSNSPEANFIHRVGRVIFSYAIAGALGLAIVLGVLLGAPTDAARARSDGGDACALTRRIGPPGRRPQQRRVGATWRGVQSYERRLGAQRACAAADDRRHRPRSCGRRLA